MTLRKKHWDVIVVGAGPAGSCAAKVAADAGLSVLIIEKDISPGLKNACAGGMPYALAEKLDLPDEVIEKKIKGCWVYVGDDKKRYQVGNPSFVTVYRRIFDKFLAERAVSCGAELMLHSKVYDVKKSEGQVVVHVKDVQTDQLVELSSKFIIFADGIHTLARKTFGLGFKKSLNNTCLAMSYELELTDNDCEDFDIFCDSQILPSGWGYFWIFPKKDRLNVGVGCYNDKKIKNLKQLLNQFIKNRPFLADKNKLSFYSGLIPLSLSGRVARENCLVIGDAGGMVNPLTGAGLVFAVRSGELAGQSCVETIRKNKCSSSLARRFLFKLYLTRHFWMLKGMGFLVYFFNKVSQWRGKSLYPQLTKMYGRFFSLIPKKLIKNI